MRTDLRARTLTCKLASGRYVGLLTGMRPHGWSVSVDERSQQYPNIIDGPIDNILSALEVRTGLAPLLPELAGCLRFVCVCMYAWVLKQGGKPIGIFLRETLQTVPTYDAAITQLNTTRLIAPVYIIVGGTTDGTCCQSPMGQALRCSLMALSLSVAPQLKEPSSLATAPMPTTRTACRMVYGPWTRRQHGGGWRPTTTM